MESYSHNRSNGALNGVVQVQSKISALEIFLDRSNGIRGAPLFSPGEVLTGSVRLNLAHSLAIKAIDLLVQGTANVAWTKASPRGDELISDDEVYLNEIAELVGKGSNQMVTLSAGEHIFPFACDLPDNLPDSFMGPNGSVSYVVKVIVQPDIREQAQDEPITETCIFSITNSLPAADFKSLLQPYRLEHRKPLKSPSLSFSSRSIKVSILLPRRAFAKGDSITASIDLTNGSRRQVKNIGLGLVMEVTYAVKGEKQSDRILVVSVDDEHVVKHLENRKWRSVSLQIPARVPCSNLSYCNLISIRYLLVFKADIERESEGVLLQLPVSVGVDIPDELRAGLQDSQIDTSSLPSVSRSEGQQQPQQQQQQQQQLRQQELSQRDAPLSRNSLPPSVPVEWREQQQQPRSQKQLQQPLEVQVDYDHPNSWQRPQQIARSSPYAEQHSHKDTQVISMRFGDELDDAFIEQQSPRVTNNPLFQQQQQPGSNGSFEQPHGRFISQFNASIHSGVDEREFLY